MTCGDNGQLATSIPQVRAVSHAGVEKGVAVANER